MPYKLLGLKQLDTTDANFCFFSSICILSLYEIKNLRISGKNIKITSDKKDSFYIRENGLNVNTTPHDLKSLTNT